MKRTGLVLGLVFAVAVLAATVSAQRSPGESAQHLRSLADTYETKDFWAKASRPQSAPGRKVVVHARKARSFTLDTAGLKSVLARAPRENTPAARDTPLVVSLPAPDGSFDRFALQESAVMAPGLARRHPGIKTYSGRGITDLSATIHADLTPLGFRASVRSANGNWYIDPYHVTRSPSVYASYFVRNAENTGHANNDTVVESTGLPVNVPDIPTDRHRSAHVSHRADQRPGLLDVPRRARERDRREGRPDQPCHAHLRGRPHDPAAADREQRSPQPQHVCPGVVAERALRLSGLLHHGRGPRVPESRAQPHRHRPDHRREQLRPRPPWDGTARRRSRPARRRRPRAKASGCTGLPTPTGDFFAVDYVAHEMGHQFSGNHTFDGNQLNCRREPRRGDLGRAGQRPIGHGLCGHLRDGRPAAAQRSVLLAAQPDGDDELRVRRGSCDQRGADRLAPALRRRRRGSGRDPRARLLAGPGDHAAERWHQRRPERHLAGRRVGERQHGHDRDRHPHGFQVGEQVTIAGVAEPGYNGTFTVTAVPVSRALQYANTLTGLPVSGGGTATHVVPGATSSGTTATIKTSVAHGRAIGDVIVDRRCRRRGLQRHVRDHGRSFCQDVPVHDDDA